ncbi:hypothetical protein F4562_004509 [Streptosporangium becharense]|uniref:Uncharacterized protein n=1 Tax=Streptosporangium becharense TaxID=1816182 RepID=A0A7W9IIN4_9ACTN|nr:hypothetical protein [Streptosporangium becharense]
MRDGMQISYVLAVISAYRWRITAVLVAVPVPLSPQPTFTGEFGHRAPRMTSHGRKDGDRRFPAEPFRGPVRGQCGMS